MQANEDTDKENLHKIIKTKSIPIIIQITFQGRRWTFTNK